MRFETIEITSMVEPLIQRDPKMSNVRKGNLMARARMIVLYDQSEAFKGLVVGTSNKTEILLGYTTLWGDMASAINPLGDLYKTQLRQLGRDHAAATVGARQSAFRRPVDRADRRGGAGHDLRRGGQAAVSCWWTSATHRRTAWRRVSTGPLYTRWSSGCAATSSSASCRPLPSSAIARSATIFCICATGGHSRESRTCAQPRAVA